MKMYVGVTDKNWFELLKTEQCDEVNFWTLGARNFKALQPNELFLFKLHKPDDYIVGGGYFVRSTVLTDYRLDVSKRLHEDYGNGRDYYKYHGQKLLILPEREEERPAKKLLAWHNENVFLG